VVLVRAQENSEIDYYVCKSKFIAKRVVKRFDKACIAKEWFYENEEYYIELEEGEICEYYKFLGIVKIFCIPRRAICNIREFTVFDDGFIWDDENMEL
jgi:hypothetical protein